MKGTTKNIFQSVLVLGLLLAGEGVMWGKSTYYAKGTINGIAKGSGNVYVAKKDTEGYSSSSQDFTDQKEDSSPVTFSIEATVYLKAAPGDGYHFVEWRQDSQDGDIIGDTTEGQKFTHLFSIESKSTDPDNPTTVIKNVYAIFEADKFNAKLTTAVSSKSDASSSTAKVSSDNIHWSTDTTAASGTSGGDVTFHVKAEPATGFKFVGWATADNTDNPSDYVPNLGASGDYTVKSHTTQGETKEYNLFAVFKKEYSITIKVEGENKTGKDRIVFKVTGPRGYKVSVPVGQSIVLKDVPEGDYTITPQTAWSWSYTVSEPQDTDYDDNHMSTNVFTVTPKSTTKKHDEVEKTVTPGA